VDRGGERSVSERIECALQTAADAFRRSGDLRGEAEAREELMRRLGRRQEWATCAEQLARLAELGSALGNIPAAVRMHLACADVLGRMDRFDDGLPHLASAVNLAATSSGADLRAEAEGIWLDLMCTHRRWEYVIERCPSIVAFAMEHRGQAFTELEFKAEYQWARALGLQGEMGASLPHAERAAAFAAAAGNAVVEGQMLLGNAVTFRFMKRYREALEAYHRVLDIAEQRDDRRVLRLVIEGIGRTIFRSLEVGDVRFSAYAERFVALAERCARDTDAVTEARCRFGAAACLELVRPAVYEASAAEYRRAGELFDSGGEIADAGQAYFRAARLLSLQSLRNYALSPEAFDLFLLAIERFRAAGKWWEKGLAEYGAATSLRSATISEPTDARKLPLMRRAARSFARAGRLSEEAGARVTAAMMWGRLGRTRSLRRSLQLALYAYERARAGIAIPAERDRFHQETAWGFRMLTNQVVNAAATSAQPVEWTDLLWQLEQAVKGRSFQDQRAYQAAWDRLIVDDSTLRGLTRRLEEAAERLSQSQMIVDQAVAVGFLEGIDAKVARRDAAEHERAEADRALRRYVRDVAAEASTALQLATVPPVTPAAVQAHLRPGEVYVGFLWPFDSHFVRLTVEPTGPPLVTVHPKPDWRLIDAFRGWPPGTIPADPLDNDPLIRAEAHALIRSLLGEVPDQANTIFIAPHEALVRLPWHHMPLGLEGMGNRLGERFSIGLVPSAGAFCQLRHDTEQEVKEPYFGVACNGDGRIPCVDIEVETVARDYFGDRDGACHLVTSTCHRFWDEHRSVDLLHMACHAGPGGLLLAPNGSWTMPSDLIQLGLRARVLLLTGCNAGSFADDDNNEFLGVVRQLLNVTGARAAVASRAPVPDAAGVLFSDLLLSALTALPTRRPWNPPARALPVGPAVEWARWEMRRIAPDTVKPLFQGITDAIDPAYPEWWGPWLVVGDPQVTLASTPR
jgi:tetratricopeptide (TPR) repeat protein